MKLIPKDDFFDNSFGLLGSSIFNDNVIMKSDIYEKDGNYVLDMDLPGMNKDDITIDYHKGYLTISASKKEENKEDTSKYIRKERYYGEYKRSFYVGDIDEDNIKASYDNGILNVVFPKENPKETKKRIDIN